MKYNKRNSSTQNSKDIQRIGNVIFNKRGHANREDREAWLRFKDYVKRLEKQSEKQMDA